MIFSISHPAREIKASVSLPASKSISNRVLILSALTGKKCNIKNLSTADDTRTLADIIGIFKDTKVNNALYNTGDGGTTMRFLISFFAIQEGRSVILNGSDRMNQRPVKPLVDALKKLGADISYLEKPGFPPLLIKGKKIHGGTIAMDGSVSSQFISSLLMVAPCFQKGLSLQLTGKIVSLPYILMTINLVKRFGINVKVIPPPVLAPRPPNGGGARAAKIVINVPPEKYSAKSGSASGGKPVSLTIEPDWSAASFWYEIAALSSAADIQIDGLSKKNIQGDAMAATIFEHLGVKTEFLKRSIRITKKKNKFHSGKKAIRIDFTHFPDLAIPFAFSCACLNIPATLTGIENLAIKESNRIEALVNELGKTGSAAIIKGKGAIEIRSKQPGGKIENNNLPVFDSHYDHRIAMGAAPVALLYNGIQIRNPLVVSKSYPSFWNDIAGAGFVVKRDAGEK